MDSTKLNQWLSLSSMSLKPKPSGPGMARALFCLSLCVCGIVVASVVTTRVGEYIVSDGDDLFFPQMGTPTTTNTTTSNNNTALNCSVLGDLREWVSPKEVWHNMSDEELMWRASMAPGVEEFPYERKAKVAFMFLTRGRLPLRMVWERFFHGCDRRLFSVYVHAPPEFVGEEEIPASSVFFRRRIPSKPVQWGRPTMVEAERRLLANALLDFDNERLVLLSESCIPLFNFTLIHSYLTRSSHSFLSSFDDPRKSGRGRYNKRMWPAVTLQDWRKGSQWFEVHRAIAISVVSDVTYYPLFEGHCAPPCYMDEHYLPTLVTKTHPARCANRSVTWVDWSRGGSHPKMYRRRDVSKGLLDRMRYGGRCGYNGNASEICFVFARKFDASALEPLLRLGPALF
ncbi:hypothetical protein QJS04_geneDACA003071 [Acorus gramineus]|uniref:Uncharacterized protein n=1 Tax=Acorus gramineus TaxID=55184 RepID=A0AAV9BU98_ACOGR|nr:hypothetical protein QJS04_geneDACA003071 [Acorus gramineus]